MARIAQSAQFICGLASARERKVILAEQATAAKPDRAPAAPIDNGLPRVFHLSAPIVIKLCSNTAFLEQSPAVRLSFKE